MAILAKGHRASGESVSPDSPEKASSLPQRPLCLERVLVLQDEWAVTIISQKNYLKRLNRRIQ
jgi:hypothetical protein